MMKRTILPIAAVIVVMVCCTMVHDAQAQRGRRGCAPGGMWSDSGFGFPPGLNLSPEQMTAIGKVRSDFFQETASLRNSMHKKNLEMQALFLEQTVDGEKAEKLQDEIFALKKDIAQKGLKARLAVRTILTPEQRAQLPPGCNVGFGRPGAGSGTGFKRGQGFGRDCYMPRW